MKIFTIVGARPNFIKIDPDLEQTIIHTGQHYDFEMSESFFRKLHLPKPKWNLECPGDKAGRMIDKLRAIFKKERPDIVIVFGDTNSSLAGALAAGYEKIKVVHVEAGLRSWRMDMPEELNRVLIDRISTVKFCPNDYSAMNLAKEGITDGVYVVGDPSFDTLGNFLPIEKTKDAGRYILLTLHRDFNVDSKEILSGIFEAIEESGENFVFPLHPRTKKNIKKFHIKIPKNVEVLKPQNYEKSLSLIANAKKVVTDSGGIQREAFWFNVPLIILREETEWLDIISKKGGVLVGHDKDKIADAILHFKGHMNPPPAPGANKRIRDILYKYL